MRTSATVVAAMGLLGPSHSFMVAPLAAAMGKAHRGFSSSSSRHASSSTRMALVADPVDLLVKGAENSMDYRVFFSKAGTTISPWHDIPLKAGPDTFNYVCEIPKNTKAKMEIATKEENNPIAQDTKKGALRFYHGPIFWNYGYLPQTWEDPNIEHPELGVMGDGDPVDVVEIGSATLASGSVTEVKPLGCLAMIDDGELDWKVIAIDVKDPLAAKLNDVADVEANCPGVVSGIREWFRWYKTPDDKPINAFGFDERCLSKAETLEVISECNGHWEALKSGTTDAGKMWVKKE